MESFGAFMPKTLTGLDSAPPLIVLVCVTTSAESIPSITITVAEALRIVGIAIS
ncbi:hypothetical protein PC116_g29687 [Phytophthora cactorum]|nr:hypothetical protein PC116_g29687 [Phytophthora cactorum]